MGWLVLLGNVWFRKKLLLLFVCLFVWVGGWLVAVCGAGLCGWVAWGGVVGCSLFVCLFVCLLNKLVSVGPGSRGRGTLASIWLGR